MQPGGPCHQYSGPLLSLTKPDPTPSSVSRPTTIVQGPAGAPTPEGWKRKRQLPAEGELALLQRGPTGACGNTPQSTPPVAPHQTNVWFATTRAEVRHVPCLKPTGAVPRFQRSESRRCSNAHEASQRAPLEIFSPLLTRKYAATGRPAPSPVHHSNGNRWHVDPTERTLRSISNEMSISPTPSKGQSWPSGTIPIQTTTRTRANRSRPRSGRSISRWPDGFIK